MYIPNGENGIYTNRIYEAVDEYRQAYSFEYEDIAENPTIFNNLLMYIYDMAIKPNISEYNDIESIDKVFTIYANIAFYFKLKPNINTFLSFMRISKDIYTSLCKGERYIYISDTGKLIYNIKEYRILYPKSKYTVLNNNIVEVSEMVKRWAEVCESALVDSVINERRNPVGMIFALKSIYGYTENGKAESTETEKIGSRSADQIASDYGSELIEKSAQLPPPADLG